MQYTTSDFVKKNNLAINFITNYLSSINVGKSKEIENEAETISIHLANRLLYDNFRNKSFTFIDLFAGIGGTRLGFELAGGHCILSNEIDPKAHATYFCNFGETIKPEFADITKIIPSQMPDFDILVGGFPCQAFSVAGERKGFQDTRGTLFFDIERIIKEKRPKAFLLENVKGLLSHDNGNTYAIIKETLEKKLKYHVFSNVLNTMEYGNIPQTRERIYIVGFSKKISSKKISFTWPSKITLEKSIADMLEKEQVDESLYYDRFELIHELKKTMTKTNTLYQWRRIYVRENKSNVCPTLTANMGTGGHNVPLLKESSSGRIRKLSPRECANFQGFPEDFYIPKFLSNSSLYKQFGNSVSVPVIQRIATQMILTLQELKRLNHCFS